MATQATINERRAGYDPAAIEPKWQQRWESDGLHRARIDPERKKHYFLTMLPYPSGDLHIGHWYAMTPSDARARYLRMKGYNVMYPIGFDSFGLPAENAAIKRNIHPKEWTYANIDRMRGQLRTMGAMWDWQREATSSDPEYYRWTQWFFLKLLAHDLAYRKHAAVDFCPNCNTTVAREQVVGEDRLCERCDTPVTKRDLNQWFLRITRYAEELLRFEGIDWPERIFALQTNWIGRSEGAHVAFRTEQGDALEVFTTRPDTLWGATFMVLAPEHPLVAKLTTAEQRDEVEAYVAAATRQTDIDREAAGREKTGVFTGGYAVNPVNDERIPIWIADYVLMTYGTGAIMAVPAHDDRDFAFARAYGLTVRPVIQPAGIEPLDGETMTEAVIAKGAMIASGALTGTPAEEAVPRTVAWLRERGIGRAEVVYRMRDWLISRQRYWGCPIPVVHCAACGAVPVPEEQLPVELPDDIEWRPTGESPLKFHPTWRHTACPECGLAAERETDTMDTFMCSSWYHLRYLSPDYAGGPFDPDEYRYWMPVDTYTGGAEHATMHLLYTRFFHKANRDMGIETGPEPMLQLRNQGQILASRRRPHEQVARQHHRPGRAGRTPRCRRGARLPDVRLPLVGGRPVERRQHPRRGALARPRVGPRPTHARARRGARWCERRGRSRKAAARRGAQQPPDHRARDPRLRRIRVQHRGVGADEADQRHPGSGVECRGGVHRPPAGARVGADPAHADGAGHAAPRRGAVVSSSASPTVSTSGRGRRRMPPWRPKS